MQGAKKFKITFEIYQEITDPTVDYELSDIEEAAYDKLQYLYTFAKSEVRNNLVKVKIEEVL